MSLPPIGFDALIHLSQFLEVKDVCSCEQVSNLWCEAMQQPYVWKQQSLKEKIPLIGGENQDYKENFKFLYFRTISARQLACFGKFLGKVPTLSQNEFNQFRNDNDPFEPNKMKHETFLLIVEPEFIQVKFDQALLEDLLKNGDAPENIDSLPQNDASDSPKPDLIIPYSHKNLAVLARHPLIKKGTGAVLKWCPPGIIWDQLNSTAKKVNICFMRKLPPKLSFDSTYAQQVELFEGKDYEVAPSRTRIFFEVVTLLNTGTGSNEVGSYVDVSTSDTVLLNGGNVLRLNVGSFGSQSTIHASDAGIWVTGHEDQYAKTYWGSVPYLDAEALGYPLLEDLGFFSAKDYSKQLKCRPDHLQKIGIVSKEDLKVICSTLINMDAIQKEVDIPREDFTEKQRIVNRRREKLFDSVESMSDALKKMTEEVKTCGAVLYESGCPWASLDQELKAFQEELGVVVNECDGKPKLIVQAFNAENYQLLASKLNALIKKFKQEHRSHQIQKLHTYINQWGILGTWNRRRSEGFPQNLASLPLSDRTLRKLFRMGE